MPETLSPAPHRNETGHEGYALAVTEGPDTPGLIVSPGLLALGVPHAFTTRAGGVSSGPFASLNFGNPMDLPADRRDPPANIAENFRRVLRGIGAEGREVVQVYQVHGAAAQVFRRGEPSRDTSPDGPRDFKADALVTDDASRVVAVRVADCVPVLLSSGDGRIVAAVHAGWRGVVAGVAGEAVRAMRDLGAKDITAAIGPGIGPEAFEVGPDVVAEFRRVFGDAAPVREHADGKGHADLQAALEFQLRGCGVSAIDAIRRCTASAPEVFFSHRRDKGVTGRMIGLIGPRG